MNPTRMAELNQKIFSLSQEIERERHDALLKAELERELEAYRCELDQLWDMWNDKRERTPLQ